MPALTISSAPGLYPVTRSELKTHLRLDSTTFAGSITGGQTIGPDAYTASTGGVTGTAVDVSNSQVLVLLNAGDCVTGGSVVAQIKDSPDDSTYTDWGTAFSTVSTGSNENAIQEKEYTGSKQYIKVVAVVTGATCDFAATVVEKAATVADDTYLDNLIKVSTEKVEANLRRRCINQTWDYYMDGWPDENFIKVPYPPLSSTYTPVVTYYNSTGGSNTFSSTGYIADTDSYEGRIVLAYGGSWPSITLYPSNPVKITYVCGYGSTRSNVPESIRQGILITAADFYEHRESMADMGRVQLLPLVTNLLAPYRVHTGFQEID